MIDLRKIRENTGEILEKLQRKDKTISLDEIILLDEGCRKKTLEADELKNQRNIVSKEIGGKGLSNEERAKKIASGIKRHVKNAGVEVLSDKSKAGGGSLPEMDFPTFAVAIKPKGISVNELEERLRKGTPPIVARIKDDALLLDARTIRSREIEELVKGVNAALYL